MLAEGSRVKGSSQQRSTSFPKVKEEGPLFSGPGPLITGGSVNDTTPATENKIRSVATKRENALLATIYYKKLFMNPVLNQYE